MNAEVKQFGCLEASAEDKSCAESERRFELSPIFFWHDSSAGDSV